jgi:hypothetical protein
MDLYPQPRRPGNRRSSTFPARLERRLGFPEAGSGRGALELRTDLPPSRALEKAKRRAGLVASTPKRLRESLPSVPWPRKEYSSLRQFVGPT